MDTVAGVLAMMIAALSNSRSPDRSVLYNAAHAHFSPLDRDKGVLLDEGEGSGGVHSSRHAQPFWDASSRVARRSLTPTPRLRMCYILRRASSVQTVSGSTICVKTWCRVSAGKVGDKPMFCLSKIEPAFMSTASTLTASNSKYRPTH